MGWLGMPRRYYDYLPEYTTYHQISTIGSWIMIIGMIIMFYNLLKSVKYGEKIDAKAVWKYGETLEWSVSTPPPPENFEHIPAITDGPYEYKFNDEPILEKEES